MNASTNAMTAGCYYKTCTGYKVHHDFGGLLQYIHWSQSAPQKNLSFTTEHALLMKFVMTLGCCYKTCASCRGAAWGTCQGLSIGGREVRLMFFRALSMGTLSTAATVHLPVAKGNM